MVVTKCDICQVESDKLADDLAVLCPECKKKYDGDYLIQGRIGQLMNQIEYLENTNINKAKQILKLSEHEIQNNNKEVNK